MDAEPPLSVIIPTKDRCERLRHTLESLALQDGREHFEVVVADNGSSDATAETLGKAAATLPITVVPVSQPEGGPATARNAAIERARGQVLLLLGDDVEPASRDLVQRHLSLHQEADDPRYAVLGRMVWDESKEVTEFMRWLDSGGPQFHYHELSPGYVPASEYFYSSHLSMSRSLLDKYGGFDERFPYAALEDTELGTRLEAAGLALTYHPELVVTHDHPTTLESSLDRMERVGQSAALFNEIGTPGRNRRVGKPSAAKQVVASIGAKPLGKLSRAPMPPAMKHVVWHYAHLFGVIQGYRKGPPRPVRDPDSR